MRKYEHCDKYLIKCFVQWKHKCDIRENIKNKMHILGWTERPSCTLIITYDNVMWKAVSKNSFHFTSLFRSCFYNEAKLHNQRNGSRFFLSRSLCFFSKAYVSQILSPSQGWLAGCFTLILAERGCVDGRDCQLYGLGYVVTGGQRCEASWHSQW